MPYLNGVRGYQRRQEQVRQRAGELHDHDELLAVDAVGDKAAAHGKDHNGNAAGETGEPQKQR